MASGSVPERLLEWYEENREGSGTASSRAGNGRNANLERAERVAKSGGSKDDVVAAMYGDIPF